MATTHSCLEAQESSDIPINEQARRLFQEAGLALNQGQLDVVLTKATQVAQLLPGDRRVQQRVAELLYRSSHVQQSLTYFDRAIELDASAADGNWQRGIALATAGEFEKGARQFEDHHRVNPDDVENSAWHFLCVSKSQGLEAARRALIPSRGDSREPMMDILAMFRQEKSPDDLQTYLETRRSDTDSDRATIFYGYLYLGLYYDALGEEQEAKQFLEKAGKFKISGYMADVARVYLKHRFKDTGSNAKSTRP